VDRNSVNWRGYVPAVTTPFDEHGALDLRAAVALFEWMADQGMHGIVVAGTTGEWFSLGREEKQALFRAAGEVLSGVIPLIAGCNAFTADEVVRNANLAAEAGFDGILVAPPAYVRPCDREIIAFYADVNSGTPLPLCVYNWPPGTNIDMSLEVLDELADMDLVVAIKNSTSNHEHFLQILRKLGDKVRIFGIPISTEGAELLLSGEGDGTMGAGAVLGRTHAVFYDALWAGDREEALEAARFDQKIMQDWFRPDLTAQFGSAQAVLKTALNLRGLPGGFPRRPILPLEPPEVDIVRQTLQTTGYL